MKGTIPYPEKKNTNFNFLIHKYILPTLKFEKNNAKYDGEISISPYVRLVVYYSIKSRSLGFLK